jgi:hypothetical protein
MELYRVQRWPDWKAGYIEVEAASEKEAAETVCGFPLREQGRNTDLRARVRRSAPARGLSTPTNFYL